MIHAQWLDRKPSRADEDKLLVGVRSRRSNRELLKQSIDGSYRLQNGRDAVRWGMELNQDISGQVEYGGYEFGCRYHDEFE